MSRSLRGPQQRQLRASAAGGFGPRDSLNRKHSPPFFGFGLRAPGVGQRPSAQARRFYEPQKHSIFLSDSSSAPPRAANASLSPRTAIPVGIALFAFGLSGSPPTGKQPNLQKCNCLSGLKPAGPKTSIASCGPPRREASARATRWAARAQPKAKPNSPPCVRLTAAPLSLRRVLPSPAGISSRFCSSQNERNPSLGGRATGFCTG